MKDSRVRKVLIKMEENKIPQLIVTSAESIFYLTGKMIHTGKFLSTPNTSSFLTILANLSIGFSISSYQTIYT